MIALGLLISILLIKYFKPLIFRKKKELNQDTLMDWYSVLKGYRISKRKASKLNLSVPQCKVCFLESINRKDLGPDTNHNPIYADYKVLCIKVKNNIVFVCKKHNLQIQISDIKKNNI